MSLNPALARAIRAARDLDVTLPAALTADYARLDELDQRAAEPQQRANLDDAFAEAFDAGRDVLTDKAVADARRPPDNLEDIRRAVRSHATRLLNRHAVDILAAFEPAFDRSATRLAEIYATIGPVNLRTETSTRTKPALVEVEKVRKITDVWSTFRAHKAGALGGRSVPDLLIVVDPDPELWWRAGIGAMPGATVWDALCVGLTPSYATPTTLRERAQRVEASRDEVLTLIEQERRAATAGHQPAPTDGTRGRTAVSA